MTTRFAAIVGAAVQRLQADPPVADVVYRARVRPVKKSDSTAIAVRLLNARVDPAVGVGTASIWGTEIAVECYARGTADVAGDEAVDALLEAAYARLMEDTTLGGLVGAIEAVGLKYDYDAEADSLACVTLILLVRHHTGASSLAS